MIIRLFIGLGVAMFRSYVGISIQFREGLGIAAKGSIISYFAIIGLISATVFTVRLSKLVIKECCSYKLFITLCFHVVGSMFKKSVHFSRAGLCFGCFY